MYFQNADLILSYYEVDIMMHFVQFSNTCILKLDVNQSFFNESE